MRALRPDPILGSDVIRGLPSRITPPALDERPVDGLGCTLVTEGARRST